MLVEKFRVLVVFLILMHTKSTEMILHLELSINLEFFLNQAKNNSPGKLISRLLSVVCGRFRSVLAKNAGNPIF